MTDLVREARWAQAGRLCYMGFSGRTLLRLLGFALAPFPVLGDQAVEIVTIRTVGAERPLIEQAFDSAAQAYLVRVVLIADRPAHFAVPAPAEHEHGGSGNAGCHNSKGNFPTGFPVGCHNREPS